MLKNIIAGLFMTLLAFNSLGQNQDTTIYKIKSSGVIFKVQVGAFSKSKPDVFEDILTLTTYVLPNGVTKYLSGEFDSYEEAVLHKKQLIEMGYSGTFVVAFKDGTPIPISSLHIVVGHDLVELLNEVKAASEEEMEIANTSNKENIDPTTAEINDSLETQKIDLEESMIPKKDVFFRVKIGEFKGGVPLETMEKFNQLKDLIYIYKTDDGYLVYSTGYFSSYEKAIEMEQKLKEIGIENTDIIGVYKDELLPKELVQRILDRK